MQWICAMARRQLAFKLAYVQCAIVTQVHPPGQKRVGFLRRQKLLIKGFRHQEQLS